MLTALAGAEEAMTLSELSVRTGLPKPTVHRLLAQLNALQWVTRDPGGKQYTVGPAFISLSRLSLSNGVLRVSRHRILEGLVGEIGETCNFTMLDGMSVVYLDRVEANWPLRLVLQPGSHVPLHCTASGKLFLAFMPEAQSDSLLADLPLPKHTRQTITRIRPLKNELADIRAQGFSEDREEFIDGLVALAVPVFDRHHRVCAAVAVHAPTARFSIEKARKHIPLLKRAATALADTIA